MNSLDHMDCSLFVVGLLEYLNHGALEVFFDFIKETSLAKSQCAVSRAAGKESLPNINMSDQ